MKLEIHPTNVRVASSMKNGKPIAMQSIQPLKTPPQQDTTGFSA
jgi:hypothetical protein